MIIQLKKVRNEIEILYTRNFGLEITLKITITGILATTNNVSYLGVY